MMVDNVSVLFFVTMPNEIGSAQTQWPTKETMTSGDGGPIRKTIGPPEKYWKKIESWLMD